MTYYCSTKNIEIKEKEPAEINTTLVEKQNQTFPSEKLGVFSAYFAKFKVGSLLNRSDNKDEVSTTRRKFYNA